MEQHYDSEYVAKVREDVIKACASGDLSGVEMFLSDGFDITFDYMMAVREAILNDQLEIIQYLLSEPTFDVNFMDGIPLLCAVLQRNIEIVNCLLEHGADPSLPLSASQGMLIETVTANGDFDIFRSLYLKLLAEHKADHKLCKSYFLQFIEAMNYIEPKVSEKFLAVFFKLLSEFDLKLDIDESELREIELHESVSQYLRVVIILEKAKLPIGQAPKIAECSEIISAVLSGKVRTAEHLEQIIKWYENHR